MDLASYLRIQMKAKGLNGIELSEKSGLKNATISKIINSKTLYPEYETLEALASALELNVQSFLDLVPSRFQERPLSKSPVEPTIARQIPIFSLETANRLDKSNFSHLQKEALALGYTEVKGIGVFCVLMPYDLFPFLTGYRLTINPNLSPIEGSYVLIRTSAKEATIGRFESDGKPYVRSLDSQKEYWKEYLDDHESLVMGSVCELVWKLA